MAHGDHAIITFIPSDAEATRKVLRDAGASFDEAEVLTASLPNRPGELARLAERLGKAGANITALIPLAIGEDEAQVAITFEDISKAREILK